MEEVKEIGDETLVKDESKELLEQQPNLSEDNQNDKNLQQQKLQEHEEVKLTSTLGEKQQQEQPQTIDYEQDGDDEEDYDDDEEKETSQKLVIDIPDDEEVEEKDEDEDDDDDDIIAINDLPPQQLPPKKETEKISPKPEKVETVITLSDGEEDVPNEEAVSKPGKVQKRRSMGAGTENEDHLRLKRRKINVAGAPKLPLTGYLRYLNDRREAVRKEHPSKTHTEHNKMIGEEWHALPADVKNSYLKAADVEKQRYVKELQSFLKSRPDILASELAKNKIRKTAENNSPNPAAATTSSSGIKSVLKDKTQTNDSSKTVRGDNIKDNKISKEIVSIATAAQHANNKLSDEKNVKRKRTPTPPSTNTNNTVSASTSSSSSVANATPGEIPIFTNEFLEHNKIYDMELRSLRKSKTDLEQQNSVLEKHVENMKFGVDKMMTENNELEEKNRLLEIYLDKLKRKLAFSLSALPLPAAPNGATVDNIDKYMQDLYKMSTSNSTGPATLNKAKDIIRKLDLQIQL